VPAGQASAVALGSSQSRSGSLGSIPRFVRVDFAQATQTVLYIMAAVMAVAAIVALLGLRYGVQEEAAPGPEARAVGSPGLARSEDP
jgi:hypothetical protein